MFKSVNLEQHSFIRCNERFTRLQLTNKQIKKNQVYDYLSFITVYSDNGFFLSQDYLHQ